MTEYQIEYLDSGLRMITYKMPNMESASIGVWVGVGGRYENKKLNGISHFIEHLLFKGTENRSAKEISQAIEGVGGHLNAFTSEEHTCYMVKVRGKHQELALDVLGDMISQPLFKQEEIEKERHVIKEEMHMILDNPSHHAAELLQELMWPGNALGRMLVGTEKSINSINRADILSFKNSHYFHSNMLVSAAGNINTDLLLKSAEQYIKKTKKMKTPCFEIFKNKQNKPNIKIINKKTEQIHICMGMHAVSRKDPDRYIVKLLSTILGENMSSRLFQIIREKHGLAYDINSHVNYFNDTGGFVISGGIKPDKLEKFINLVLKELKNVKKNSVAVSELKHAKEFYEGQLAINFEKTMTKMLWMGENLMSTGRVPGIKDVLAEIEKINIDDLYRIANNIFNNNILNVSIIGPVKEDTKLELDL